MTSELKIINLALALACFGGAMAILAVADDALAYSLVVWNLAGTALMIWQGRLWK